MDWQNLLSGTIGALIGAFAVFGSTFVATRQQVRQGTIQARQADALAISASLARLLIQFYEGLTDVLASRATDDRLDTSGLRESCTQLRMAITVDAPMLPPNLAATLESARDELKLVIGRAPVEATRPDLVHLLKTVKEAGDLLKKTRAESYMRYGPGAILGDPEADARRSG
jgi:hypothetical protein